MATRSGTVVAHRVPVPKFDAAPKADYSDAFEIANTDATLSAEDWARAIFEGPPRLVRLPLMTGWRFGLGFRLVSPRSSMDDVSGWPIVVREPGLVELALDSALLSARLSFQVDDASVQFITRVGYRRWAGRPLWTVGAAQLHWQIVPFLLRRAAREAATATAAATTTAPAADEPMSTPESTG